MVNIDKPCVLVTGANGGRGKHFAAQTFRRADRFHAGACHPQELPNDRSSSDRA